MEDGACCDGNVCCSCINGAFFESDIGLKVALHDCDGDELDVWFFLAEEASDVIISEAVDGETDETEEEEVEDLPSPDKDTRDMEGVDTAKRCGGITVKIISITFKNLKSTGVHNGMGVERWFRWSPPSFIQIGPKLPKFVIGVVLGWVVRVGETYPPSYHTLIYCYLP